MIHISEQSYETKKTKKTKKIKEARGAKETIGARVRGLREARGLSTEDVWKLTGISGGNLNLIENDKVKPAAENSMKLAKCFGVTVDYLLNGDSPNSSKASETKERYLCEIKISLPDPSNQLVEDLNLFAEILAHGDPQLKFWLEGRIKWDARKLRNWEKGD